MLVRNFDLVGAAFGLATYHRGNAKAPGYLRKAGLLEKLHRIETEDHRIFDSGDISEPAITTKQPDPRLKYLEEVLRFSNDLIPTLRKVYEAGRSPLLIGGDHSISIASIGVAAEALKKRSGASARLGVLWVDAHADINTPETTPSGNIHGMSLAHSLGYGNSQLCQLCGFTPKLLPENLIYIGLRDLDPGEKETIKRLGIKAFTMREVDELGAGEVCRSAFEYMEKNTDGFVLSFDLDVCDPVIAPGVGVPVRGGLSFREAHLVMEMAAQTRNLLSIEVVEYNPDLDINGVTGEMAMGLIESALGKSIL
jgi:arginase